MAENNGNGAKSPFGPLLSFIGQAWPVILSIAGLIWVFSEVLHQMTALNKRFDTFETEGRVKESRIATLERQAGIFDERLNTNATSIAEIYREAEANRQETQREHDEIKALLRQYPAGRGVDR